MRRNQKINWRVNEGIRATDLRVIGPDGKQIGILKRDKALEQAHEAELDLVEIAPNAHPPVAKIINFAKFKYAEEKKAKEERKREKKGTAIKEIWFTPLIGQGDYSVRLGRVKEFLARSEKVRIVVRPKRRLPTNNPLYRVLERVVKDLEEIAKVEQEPKMVGRQLITLVAPGGKPKNEDQNENQKNSNPPVQGNSGRENST